MEVYSQVSGRVLAVRYREGEFVRQGQLLVEFHPRPMEAQLRQAEGSLARDKAALDQARGNLKRYQDALLKNAVAQQTVFDQEAAVRQDEGTVENDEERWTTTKSNSTTAALRHPFRGVSGCASSIRGIRSSRVRRARSRSSHR